MRAGGKIQTRNSYTGCMRCLCLCVSIVGKDSVWKCQEVFEGRDDKQENNLLWPMALLAVLNHNHLTDLQVFLSSLALSCSFVEGSSYSIGPNGNKWYRGSEFTVCLCTAAHLIEIMAFHLTCRHLFVVNSGGLLDRPDRTLEVGCAVHFYFVHIL